MLRIRTLLDDLIRAGLARLRLARIKFNSSNPAWRVWRWKVGFLSGIIAIGLFASAVGMVRDVGAAEPLSATIRNLALALGGPLAIFALWLAWRRTRDATRQVETQIKQADTAERGHLNDRYQSGVHLLSSEQEKIQLAGIAQLDRLRDERPDPYESQVRPLFASLVSGYVPPDPDFSLGPIGTSKKPRAFITPFVFKELWQRIMRMPSSPQHKLAKITIDGATVRNLVDYGGLKNIRFRNCNFQIVVILDNIFDRNIEFDSCNIKNIRLDIPNFDEEQFFGRWSIFDSCVFERLEVGMPPGAVDACFLGGKYRSGADLDNELLREKLADADTLVQLVDPGRPVDE